MKKRITGVLLAVLMMVTLCVPVFAEDAVPYASDQFVKVSVDISAQDNGQIAIDCKAYGTGVMSSIGMTKLVVFEKTGTTWLPVETMTSSENPSFTAKNAVNFGTSVWYAGTIGKQYYVQVTFKATNSAGSDTRTATTATITATA